MNSSMKSAIVVSQLPTGAPPVYSNIPADARTAESRGHARKVNFPPMSLSEKLTGLSLRDNGPIALVSFGHAATHWIGSTFYVLLPFLALSLGLGYAETGLLVSVIHTGSLVANFGSGPLVDMTGRRVFFQVLSVAVGALALAGLGGFGAESGLSSMAWLICMVAIMGMTANLWHPPALSYLSERYPRTRGYAFSIHALGASLGDTVAPLCAGLLLLSLDWRETAVAAAIPALCIAALIAVTIGPGARRAVGGASKQGLGLLAYFGNLRDVLRNRVILSICVMAGLRSMTQSGLTVFLPLYLVNVLGAGPAVLGATLAALQAGGLIATPVAGIWSDRVGRRPVVMAGLTASTVIICSLGFLGGGLLFIAGISLLGFALFAIRPVVQSWMMDMTPPSMTGSATSLMFGTQSCFNIAMPVIGGIVADLFGLTAVFYLLGVTMLASNLVVFLLPKETGRTA
jgi:MFS family permease